MKLTADQLQEIDFKWDPQGLIPAVVQHAHSGQVLMLGYQNLEALEHTFKTGFVTFYSRSKQRLWKKGEESGNVLKLQQASLDCDRDTVLIKAIPAGPVCHKGTPTCFDAEEKEGLLFLDQLEGVIADRKANPTEKSYTAQLFAKGINKVAQKVGEEAVEVVIEAKDDNRDLFLNESADLLYHYLVLLHAKDAKLEDVLDVLKSRHG